MTGAFYDKATGRLYFTLSGQSSLYYRYFQPQSRIVGGQRFTAQASRPTPRGTRSAACSSPAASCTSPTRSNGNLSSVTWANSQAVNGTRVTMSGPGIDGNDWRGRGLVLTNN